jgi:ribosome maturation factor RimP
MATVSGQKKYHKSDRRPEQAPLPGKAELKTFLVWAREVAEAALAPLGLELVVIQCPVEGGRPVLRLFIDKAVSGEGAEAAPAGSPLASQVTLDDCAAASRALDAMLEGDDREPPAGYVLEVSSPGLDRPLVKPADYPRFAGRLVKLKLRQDGRNSAYKGRLAVAADGALSLETADGPVPFSFDDVTSCRLSLDEVEF